MGCGAWAWYPDMQVAVVRGKRLRRTVLNKVGYLVSHTNLAGGKSISEERNETLLFVVAS